MVTHSTKHSNRPYYFIIALLSLGLHSCRTGCGCPMAQTERGFQVAPKSSPITHKFIRGNKDASSHGIQPDFIIIVVKEAVLTQVVSGICFDID